MDNAQIYATLNGIFRVVFDDDTITIAAESTAADVDGWDSLNHVRLVLAVEDGFNVHFSAAEIGKLKNVGQLVDLIKSKLPVGETPIRSKNQ